MPTWKHMLFKRTRCFRIHSCKCIWSFLHTRKNHNNSNQRAKPTTKIHFRKKMAKYPYFLILPYLVQILLHFTMESRWTQLQQCDQMMLQRLSTFDLPWVGIQWTQFIWLPETLLYFKWFEKNFKTLQHGCLLFIGGLQNTEHTIFT